MSPPDAPDAAASGGRPGRFRIAFVLLLAAILIGVGIVGLSTREAAVEYRDVQGAGDAQRIFGGVRQLGERLGEEGAPVQLQVFTDVQSAGYADWFLDVIPTLTTGPVRQGEINLLLRNRSFTRNATQLSFYGVESAAEQDYGWNYAYLMVRNQDLAVELGLDQEFLESLAESIEALEVPVWRDAFEAGVEPDSEMTASLEEQDKLAIDLELPAEPAVVVAGDGGTEVLMEAPDLGQIQAAISEVR